MKLKVQHYDGSIETLTLVPPFSFSDTPERYFNQIHGADGTDYYFTQEGVYDGWGRAMSGTAEEASQIIGSVESDRKIEPPERP